MTLEVRFQAHKISQSFTVHVQDPSENLSIPQYSQDLIEQIWQEELKKSDGHLFNGQLLSFVALEKDRLIGKFVDYKHYIAQHKDPRLQPFLQIEPIGVSSLTMCGEKYLCGCRSLQVSTYPEHYELAPSGGLDSEFSKQKIIDLKGQLVSELYEETGIHHESVISVKPFALIHDKLKGGYDICINLELKPEAVEKTLLKSHEYGTLIWKDKEELRAVTKKQNNNWVPLSIYLIDHYL